MKTKYRLSFLVPAHNEEKLVCHALKRLVEVHRDYPNMEVLIGLDGCTDKTPKIARDFAGKNKFFRIFELNERRGKQAILDRLEPHAKGDIVIVHDADLVFVYKSKSDLFDFLSLFDNPEIGAIADSIDSEMSKPNFLKIKSLGFLASAWGNHLLNDYNKEKFTKEIDRKNKIAIINQKKMKFCPFVDIYRKKAIEKTKHKEELRAGDHVERTLRILNAGYDVIMFRNKNWPHFNESYSKQPLTGLVNQKIRGIISKKRIGAAYNFNISFWEFHLPFAFYVLKHSFKVKRFIDFVAIYLYLFIEIYACIIGNLDVKQSARAVWELRINR